MNVAEKPSVARTISEILSNRSANKISSLSMYNPIFNFDYKIAETSYKMKFTSLTGHLMAFEFAKENEKWKLETIKNLFSAEISKEIIDGSENIASTIKELAK